MSRLTPFLGRRGGHGSDTATEAVVAADSQSPQDPPADAVVGEPAPATPAEEADRDDPGTAHDEPASVAAPPVAVDTDRWPAHRVPTAAPEIGRVLPPPRPTLGRATVFRRPMLSLDSVFLEGYHVAAGSLSGTGHQIAGTPCQDSVDFVLAPDGRLIVAIADGLGSRDFSQVGARGFGEGVVRAAVERDGLGAAELIALGARYAEAQAQWYGLTAERISFVGAVAVLGTAGCEIARVGDVSAFSLEGGEFTELLENDADGSVNVVHAALPGSPPPEPETCDAGAVTRLVLCTDGLAADLRNSAGVRTWLARAWEAPGDIYGMGEALRFRRQGSHDDRTAVVISTVGNGETGR